MLIPKRTTISIGTFLLSMVSLFIFMGLTTPKSLQIHTILAVLVLIYICTASFSYMVISFFGSNNVKSINQISLLLGCVLPAMVILNSLKQASAFDILLIIITVGLILGYVLSKR
jgi:hypothetical protein